MATALPGASPATVAAAAASLLLGGAVRCNGHVELGGCRRKPCSPSSRTMSKVPVRCKPMLEAPVKAAPSWLGELDKLPLHKPSHKGELELLSTLVGLKLQGVASDSTLQGSKGVTTQPPTP